MLTTLPPYGTGYFGFGILPVTLPAIRRCTGMKSATVPTTLPHAVRSQMFASLSYSRSSVTTTRAPETLIRCSSSRSPEVGGVAARAAPMRKAP